MKAFLLKRALIVTLSLVAFPALAEQKTIEVTISEYAFTPQNLTIAKGDTVVWTNKDETPHNVVAEGKVFKSPALDTEESFRQTFTSVGTFAYVCALHPHMTGRITVTP